MYSMAIKRLIFALRKSLKSLSGGCILHSQTVVLKCSCQEKKNRYKKCFGIARDRSVTPFDDFNSVLLISLLLVFNVDHLFQ